MNFFPPFLSQLIFGAAQLQFMILKLFHQAGWPKLLGEQQRAVLS